MFKQFATIQPGFLPFQPFAWKIHVRCDDPGAICSCGKGSDIYAYTTNPVGDDATINFCPLYFTLGDLDQSMRYGNDKSQAVEHWADLTNYIKNKGRTWTHELFHIDWVSNAKQYGPNAHVTDINYIFKTWDPEARKTIYKLVVAYNADGAKTLARWAINTVYYTKMNADNLTMFAFARYVQKALGNIYPHLPLAPLPPEVILPPQDPYIAGDLFTVDADGIGQLGTSPELSNLVRDPDVVCGTNTDELNLQVSADDFALQSAFPADYLALYNSWRQEYENATIGSFRRTGVAPGKAVKPGTELRILPVGDSITVGFLSDQEGGDGNGYRLRLRNDLSRDHVVFAGTESTGTMSDGYFAAWSGKTIKYISDHIDPSLKQRPNIILVHAGTNDMNPNTAIATEGNDPAGAAQRLGDLIDQMTAACPDATILVAMIISTCDAAQQANTARYQALVPDVVRQRQADGKHVIAVDFTSFPTSSLRDCIHPTNEGYQDFGDYWYDFVTQIPNDWIRAPVGDDPKRPNLELPGVEDNGGLDYKIPPPNWGDNPITPSSKAAIRSAADAAGEGKVCKGLPIWQGTGQIALGVGQDGAWKYQKNWAQTGKVADGLHLDPKYVRLHDMNGDGKADYIWLNPDTGEIRCWINNLPQPWSPAGTNNSIIGSGAGVADSVFLADMNGDGLEDYMVVNPNNGAVRIWWNYGPDNGWFNGWKFVDGGQIASGVPHANWATLRFPDINGDGRADYVYIGAGGSLEHWLNTGSPGGQDVLFLAQGGIATGATPDISKLVFADIDGDGRDDYLIWDDQAGLTGFLNQPSEKEGVPVYVNQGPPKTIADGITQDPSSIRLADIDGDGMDDYAYVDQNGAIWLWYNRGTTDNSMAIDGLRFADIDGDGLDDYVWLHPDTGAPVVYLNRGPDETDALGWSWSPLNEGKPIASGAAPASKVQFGDIDGDGKDDYLVVDPKTGELTAYLNVGQDLSRAEKWLWNPIGSIATGLGPGKNVRFADIDGDGFDDYIYLHPNGGTTIYRNVFNLSTPLTDWKAMPEADASGIGQRPEEISFHDINGDGKADYIWTRAYDGAASVWLNNYPKTPTWLAQPQIAGGVGVSGADVRYAVLQKTGRASYVAVDRNDGAIAAWLNGCNDLEPSPPPPPSKNNLLQIGQYELYTGIEPWFVIDTWFVFDNTVGHSVEVCTDLPIAKEDIAPLSNPSYPEEIKGFKSHGVDGCTYQGTSDKPGTLSCPGMSVQCSQDQQHDERLKCGDNGWYTPVVICQW